MSEDVVTRAEDALVGVTEGPWEWREDARTGEQDLSSREQPIIELVSHCEDWLIRNASDGEFIAESRTLVPELAAKVKAQAAEIVQLREKLIDAELARINDGVNHWHDGSHGADCQLHEFLGMTWDEYRAATETPREFVRQKLFGGEQ